MKNGSMRTICGTILAVAVAAGAMADESLMMMRLRAPHTADDVQWAKTFKALSENRAACDEVWFSTEIRWGQAPVVVAFWLENGEIQQDDVMEVKGGA